MVQNDRYSSLLIKYYELINFNTTLKVTDYELMHDNKHDGHPSDNYVSLRIMSYKVENAINRIDVEENSLIFLNMNY